MAVARRAWLRHLLSLAARLSRPLRFRAVDWLLVASESSTRPAPAHRPIDFGDDPALSTPIRQHAVGTQAAEATFPAAPSLLAVDLGLRTGLALYGRDARLRWYRSRHFGAPVSLRRAVPALLEGVSHLVIEGGGALAAPWADEALARGLEVRWVSAETWRAAFLYPREQRTGERAKRTADELARRVIAWSGARRPTSLRHDAAEAILIGLWGMLELGWLRSLPPGLVHNSSAPTTRSRAARANPAGP